MTEPDEAILWAREQSALPAVQTVTAHAYRTGAAASAERIKALEAALREVADDLEAEIKARAGGELPRRVERDLEPVFRARAILAKYRGEA